MLAEVEFHKHGEKKWRKCKLVVVHERVREKLRGVTKHRVRVHDKFWTNFENNDKSDKKIYVLWKICDEITTIFDLLLSFDF